MVRTTRDVWGATLETASWPLNLGPRYDDGIMATIKKDLRRHLSDQRREQAAAEELVRDV